MVAGMPVELSTRSYANSLHSPTPLQTRSFGFGHVPNVVVVVVVSVPVVVVAETVDVELVVVPVVTVYVAVDVGVDVTVVIGVVLGDVVAVPGNTQNSSTCSSSGTIIPSGHGSQY